MTGLVTKRKPAHTAARKRWAKVQDDALSEDALARGRKFARTQMSALTAIYSGGIGDATVAYTQKVHWAVLDLLGGLFSKAIATAGLINHLEARISDLEGAREKAAPPMIYRGVFVDGETYDAGNTATFGGSLWHCNNSTKERPGDGSKMWTLCVKRGRDGKDLRP